MLAKLNLVDLSPTTQGRKIQEIIETTNQIAKFQKRMEEQEKQIEELKKESQELKKESQEQAKKMTILSFVSRYSTRNEHDIGSLILKDTEEGTLKHLEFSAHCVLLNCHEILACFHGSHQKHV
jgi:predicted RNase H-like nuclease (RuvC/YqgF family)